jgi:hypothetical protein
MQVKRGKTDTLVDSVAAFFCFPAYSSSSCSRSRLLFCVGSNAARFLCTQCTHTRTCFASPQKYEPPDCSHWHAHTHATCTHIHTHIHTCYAGPQKSGLPDRIGCSATGITQGWGQGGRQRRRAGVSGVCCPWCACSRGLFCVFVGLQGLPVRLLCASLSGGLFRGPLPHHGIPFCCLSYVTWVRVKQTKMEREKKERVGEGSRLPCNPRTTRCSWDMVAWVCVCVCLDRHLELTLNIATC